MPRGSKSRGTKRGNVYSDERQDAPKRQKETPVFQFLNLPGEIRNHVYELAVAETAKQWPPLSDCDCRRGAKALCQKKRQERKDMLRFLGLSQACTKIRTEFRGLWLQSLRVSLKSLERYISVFLRKPPVKSRSRFDTYFNKTGTLRVWIRESELREDKDIIRVLKLKAQLPGYNVVCEHTPSIPVDVVAGLNQLIENQNPKWLQWVRAHAVTQVRATIKDNRIVPVNLLSIVVKERYSEPWMKPSLRINIPDGYLATLGLDQISGWDITFGVSYS